MNIKQTDGSELIQNLATELKSIKTCDKPEWAQFVKTGVGKTRPPVETDWWHVRSASVLRKVALLGPIGVNKLKKHYGTKKRRGYKPSRFSLVSGKILRTVLQQLEQGGLIKQTVVSGHKGRVLDKKGAELVAKAMKSGRKTVKEEKQENGKQ